MSKNIEINNTSLPGGLDKGIASASQNQNSQSSATWRAALYIKNNSAEHQQIKNSSDTEHGIVNNSDLLYDKSIPMLQLLNKVCPVSGSGFLPNTYFYHFNKSNRYKLYKLISHIFHILNHFFGTFYGIISKPVFLFTQKKLLIFINYYIPKPSNRLFNRHN
jgi:hypothetical protein